MRRRLNLVPWGHPSGLLAHAVLLCVLLTVGTALAVGAVLVTVVNRQVDRSADSRLSAVGEDFHHVLNGEQQAMLSLATALATRPQISRELSESRPANVEDILRLVLRPPTDELLVAGLEGGVIARASDDPDQPHPATIPLSAPFRQAIAGHVSTGLALSEAGVPEQEVYVPIVVDSQPRWVLRLADYIDQAELDRLHLSSRLELSLLLGSRRVATTLRDGDGRPLLGAEQNLQLLTLIDRGAKEASGLETMPNGTFRARYSPLVDEQGAHVATLVMMIPDSTVLSQLGGALLPVTPVLLIILLGAGALAFLLVKCLTRPLLELKRAARRMQEGDLETPVPVVGEPLLEPLRAELEWARSSIAHNQRALKEAEGRYRDLVENTTHVVCLHDLDGRVLYGNPAALTLLGKDSPRLNLRDVMVEDVRGEFGFYVGALQDKGAAQGLMTVASSAGRRVLNYSASVRSDSAAGGEVVRLMADDVTDRFALLALRNAIFAGAREPMLAVDPDGRVALYNAAAAALFSQDLDARPSISELLPFLDEAQRNGASTAVGSGTLVRTDGQRIEVEVSRAVLRDGLPIGALYVVHDVSTLKELSQQREELLHNVAHELRGPISVLDNALCLIADGYGDMSAGELDGMLNSARRMSKRLGDLVGDMLSAGSIQAGKFSVHPQSMSLKDLVNAAADNVRARTELTGQRITFQLADGDTVVLADPVYAVRALTNLLSNASKYSESGSSIEVRTELLGYDAKISVVDCGMGIPREQQAGIFDRYYRASGSGQQPGVGLGLAIVKGIVEAHSGSIGMVSQQGQGSTFWFTLPLQAGALPAVPRTIATQERSSRP